MSNQRKYEGVMERIAREKREERICAIVAKVGLGITCLSILSFLLAFVIDNASFIGIGLMGMMIGIGMYDSFTEDNSDTINPNLK